MFYLTLHLYPAVTPLIQFFLQTFSNHQQQQIQLAPYLLCNSNSNLKNRLALASRLSTSNVQWPSQPRRNLLPSKALLPQIHLKKEDKKVLLLF